VQLARILKALFHQAEASLPFQPASASPSQVRVVADEFVGLARPCLGRIEKIDKQVSRQGADNARLDLVRSHGPVPCILRQFRFMP
jgi:hypothetical protein